MYSDRIKKLRRQSLELQPTISEERALLLTQFYKKNSAKSYSIPVMRAKSFYDLMERKALCINDGELIVGEKGPAPKATPSYPEICIHSQEDLKILNDREKVNFLSDEQTRSLYKDEIEPYWKGKSNREKLLDAMTPEWLDAYRAGVFTEFQEQRGPGHTVADRTLFQYGMVDLKERIAHSMQTHQGNIEKCEELKAMAITADAIMRYADRHAEALQALAQAERDTRRKLELEQMAAICKRVPRFAPRTFHEALQHYWFIHLGITNELNPWDAFNPGRLDQNLYPFYQAEREAGTLDNPWAKELLYSFWIKFNNQPAPPKVGVTAKESNTYTDFCLINLGGLKEDGSDAVNDLTYLLLDVIEEMRLLQPSSMVQLSEKNPDAFIQRAIKISKTGFGQPSIFNTETLVTQMLSQGKSLSDARNGGTSGCVETGAFGKEAYVLTGYFNLSKVLEITLHNGIDPNSGERLGLATGEFESFSSMAELMLAFQKQVQHFIDIKVEGNHRIDTLFKENLPVPFLSLFIDDCIARGEDYLAGGARYNTSYIQGVGLGSITDSLAAINALVYTQKECSAKTLLEAMSQNFSGYEALRMKMIYDLPKWGNDDDSADVYAKQVFDIFHDAVTGRPTVRGGVHRINMLPTTCHVYFGSMIGALPSGRKAKKPLSEGISPVQGADSKGPTAVIKSASKIDHLKTGGTLLNQKFTPSFFSSQKEIIKVGQLVRSYFALKGHHIQFNVVDADILRKAQQHPEEHRDLIVRVAGYSDYFNDLGEDLQNEIIERTAHDSF